MNFYKIYGKRILDISLATIGILISSPLMIAIDIWILIDMKQSPIFKQKRIGYQCEPFTIYKFRTMYDENTVSKSGAFLRKTSLDELPQFFNVIKGDMSLIGPRPFMPIIYQNMLDQHKKRNDMRPGMTGLAQINGRRNLKLSQILYYDLNYIQHCSLKKDIQIIGKTISVVYKQTGNIENKKTKELQEENMRWLQREKEKYQAMQQEIEKQKQYQKESKH